jgi:hypothetical protein
MTEEKKQKAAEYARNWRKNNPEKAKAAFDRYTAKNPERRKRFAADWNQRNPDYHKQWNLENRVKRRAQQAKLRAENPEKYRAATRKWQAKNKEKRADYIREKRRSCAFTKISSALRSRIYDAITKAKATKRDKSMNLIGCTVLELMDHLAAKFTEGMTWENHGKWHIDHIRPCSEFDLADPVEQMKCFHFSNLQPLWARDNLMKSGPKRNRKPPTP